MSKQVRLTLAKAIAKSNLLRAEAGRKPITMNSLAVQAGVATTTITRLARSNEMVALKNDFAKLVDFMEYAKSKQNDVI